MIKYIIETVADDLLLFIKKFRLFLNMHDDQNPTNISSAASNAIVSTPELQREVAELMIECLNLEVTSDEISADDPLYGEGLGLDSIDILEIALVVSKRYGLQLRGDNVDNVHIFSSLRNLSDYIAAKRTK